MVTAGGVVFIAATNHDRKMRAFDKATGEFCGNRHALVGQCDAGDVRLNGRQFVVVAAGGGKSPNGGPGGIYVAFALPSTATSK